MYDKLAVLLKRRLITLSKKTNPPLLVWIMAKYRRLVLLTSWLGFPYVEATCNSDSMESAIKLFNKRKLVPQWLQFIRNNEQISKDDYHCIL